MASINGISVKGVKEFRGHEGEPLAQGNLYLNNKKIGFWSQDSWGGPDIVDLDPKYSYQLLKESVISLNPDKAIHGGTPDEPYVIEYDLEMLVFDCLKLAEDEKTFNKAVKAGYSGVLIASDGHHVTFWQLPESYTKMTNENLLKSMDSLIKTAKAGFFKENEYTKHTVKIYRSPNDFIIGEPIRLEDISVKKGLDKVIADADKSAGKGHKNPSDSLPKTKRSEPER